MRMRAIATLFAFILALCCLDVTASPEVKLTFTTEELLADYDQMWEILYESFPFLSLAGKSEAELEALRLENRALLGSRVTDAAGLYMVMQHTCRALGNVGHLQTITPAYYRGLEDNGLRHRADPSKASSNPDPQSDATYRMLSKGNTPPFLNPTPSVNTRYYEDIRALYLQFPTFRFVPSIDQPVPIAHYLSMYPGTEHVIFDICGNAGGYNENWMYHIVSAFEEPVTWSLLSYLRVTEVVANNYEGFELEPIVQSSPALPEPIKALGMTHIGRATHHLPMDDYQAQQVDRPVQRWLLVDGSVYSGADALTRFCIDTGWAKVAGRTTLGDGVILLGPSIVRVDNTGLLFAFLPEGGINPDGTLNTLRGTLPDYPSKPGERPLDTCLRLIREANDASR